MVEQAGNGQVERLWVAEVLAHDLGEHPTGQQAGVLGVEAEHYLVEVSGQFFRVFVVFLHFRNDVPEQSGGFPGDIFHRPVRTEPLRSEKDVPQLFQVPGLGQFRHRDFVQDRFQARKVGAYSYP